MQTIGKKQAAAPADGKGEKFAVREKPILFCDEMVRAILAGRKTQTRRVVKPQPTQRQVDLTDCPYGGAGDRLWVRETFGVMERSYHPELGWETDGLVNDVPVKDVPIFSPYSKQKYFFVYRADGYERVKEEGHWIPPIYMPRRASRITLEIVGVRVEHLRDISEDDAKAGGICLPDGSQAAYPFGQSYCDGFFYLWDGINQKRGFGWDTNPFVWVIEFRRIDHERL